MKMLCVNDCIVLCISKTESYGIETIKGLVLSRGEVSYLIDHLKDLREARNTMITKRINEIGIITEIISTPSLIKEGETLPITNIKFKTFKYGHIEIFLDNLSQIIRWL